MGATYIVRTAQNKLVTKAGGAPKQFPPFGSYGAKKLSPGYLAGHLVADFVRRKRLLISRVMMATGEVLSGDMSFKVAKHICVGNVKYGATWSVMNEFGELLGVYFCRTKSLAEVVRSHELLQSRYGRAGLEGPKVFYSDQAGLDEATLTRCHPSLCVRASTYASCNPQPVDPALMKLPNEPLYIKTVQECDAVCADLRRNAVLGYDMEWNKKPTPGRERPAGPHKSDGKVATIQLATELRAAVFHLPALNDVIPDSLRALLEDPSILKVGVHSTRDASRLLHDFGLQVANVAATEELAKEVLKLDRRGWGLQDLCRDVLGKDLPKDVCCHTQWELVDLKRTELYYAALDAYASLCVHTELAQMKLRSRGTAASAPSATAAPPVDLEDEDEGDEDHDPLDQAFADDSALEDDDDALHESPTRGAPSLNLNDGEEPDRRVKNDAFHIMQLYSRSLSSRSRSEPMLGVFANLMMNAMFILDADDQKEVVGCPPPPPFRPPPTPCHMRQHSVADVSGEECGRCRRCRSSSS